MAYSIAGIDVHKKKLAVVVADVEVEEAYQFERRWYGSNPEQLLYPKRTPRGRHPRSEMEETGIVRRFSGRRSAGEVAFLLSRRPLPSG